MATILLTGGATRNPIDATRYISAGASGETAIAVGNALRRERGPADRILLLGSAEAGLRAQLAQWGAPGDSRSFLPFGSTRDLLEQMRAHASSADVIVHSAAVGDYEAAPLATKIPSQRPEITIRMTPAPKILDQLRGWAPHAFLVSFKAGSPEWSAETLETVARAQLHRTGSDLVFANNLGALNTSAMIVSAKDTTNHARRGGAIAALILAIQASAQYAGTRMQPQT